MSMRRDQLLSPDLIITKHLGQCLGKDVDLSTHRFGLGFAFALIPDQHGIAHLFSLE